MPSGAQRHAESLKTGERARERLPAKIRQQLLDAVYDRKPFRQALREPRPDL